MKEFSEANREKVAEVARRAHVLSGEWLNRFSELRDLPPEKRGPDYQKRFYAAGKAYGMLSRIHSKAADFQAITGIKAVFEERGKVIPFRKPGGPG